MDFFDKLKEKYEKDITLQTKVHMVIDPTKELAEQGVNGIKQGISKAADFAEESGLKDGAKKALNVSGKLILRGARAMVKYMDNYAASAGTRLESAEKSYRINPTEENGERLRYAQEFAERAADYQAKRAEYESRRYGYYDDDY